MLQDAIFTGLNIIHLRLNNNQLATVNVGVFNSLCLKSLDLSNNTILFAQKIINGCIFVTKISF